MTTNRLTAILSVGVVIVIGLIILFSRRFSSDIVPLFGEKEVLKDTIQFEVIKSLLHLLVVIILGGIVAGLFKAAENAKQRTQVLHDLRLNYLKRLGVLYRAAKASRRELRAGGLSTKYENDPNLNTEDKRQLYIDQMKRINKIQLRLEDLKKEAITSPALQPYKSVFHDVEKMEKYLSEILDEFAKAFQKLQKGETINFKRLEKLDEFTGSTRNEITFSSGKNYRFKSHFSKPYDNVIQAFT